MTYDGFLAFGGNEIANNGRTRGYAETATCPMFWYKGPTCPGIWDVLGETDLYSYANITGAPWYDSTNEASTRFFGVYIIDIEGLNDSTRQVSVTEGVGHGGVLGPTRKAVKSVRVKAMLAADGADALEYGMAWLSAVLDPGACGQHGSSCGTVDLAFFADCPPTREEIRKPFTEWSEPLVNLATNPSMETPGASAAVLTNWALNPSMEAAGATAVVRQNLATNPSFEAATAATAEVRRNLATDPSFESPAVMSPVYTNLALNPSFEAATAANVEVRRNLATHPRGVVAAAIAAQLGAFNTRGFGLGPTGAGTHALVTASDGPVPGSMQYLRKTWTVSGASSSTGFDLTTPLSSGVTTAGFPVTAGETYTISAWMRHNAPASKGTRLIGYFHDAAGAYVNFFSQDSSQTSAQGWVRSSYTFTVPANAVSVGIALDVISGSPWAVNERLDISNVMLEKSTILGAYFDGTTTAAGDFFYAWTGAADASASIQGGYAAPTTGAFLCAAIQSTAWASTGGKSLRIIPNYPSNSSRAVIAPVIPVVPGETYTIVAKIRMTAPQTGSLWTNARKLSAYFTPIATLPYGPQAPNVEGVQELRWTVTVPDGATGMDARMNMGTEPGGGEMWVDDVMVVKGTYNGPYFDGTTAAKIRRNLARDPSAVSGLGWSDYFPGTVPTVSLVTGASDGPEGASTYRRMAATPVSSNTGGPRHAIATGLFSPGDPVTASMWVRTNVAKSMNVVAQYSGFGQNYGTAVSVPANVWTKLSVTGTIPAAAGAFSFSLVPTPSTGWAAGVPLTIDTSRVMIEKLSAAGGTGFFDGSNPLAPYGSAWEGAANDSASYLADTTFTSSWTGTPDASTSVLSAPLVTTPMIGTVWGNDSSSLPLQTSEWSALGTKSWRQVPLNGAAYQYLNIGASLVAGKVYTALVTFRMVEAQTHATPAARARSLVYSESGATIQQSQAPNTPGVTELRITFTLGASGTRLIMFYGQAYSVGAVADSKDVWWDKLLIVEGNYTGPYFDGSTVPTDPDLTYAWVGAVNGSASAQYGTVATMSGGSNANCATVLATDWASTGTKSLRQIPNTSSPASYTVFPGHSLGMIAGKTYTVLAKSRLIAPQTGGLENSGRVRQVMIRQGTGGTDLFSTKAPNAAGVTEHRLTAVMMDPNNGSIFLWNGAAAGGGDVWWDDILVVEGVYNGPYFDGSTPAKVRRNFHTNPFNGGTVTGGLAAGNAQYVTVGNTPAFSVAGGWQKISVTALPASSRAGFKRTIPITAYAGQVVRFALEGRGLLPAGVAARIYVDAIGTNQAVVPGGHWDALWTGEGTITGALPALGAQAVNLAYYVWLEPSPYATAFAGQADWEVSNGVIEIDVTPGPAFDGGTGVAPYAGVWEGTPYASASYLTDPDFTYEWSSTLFSLPGEPNPDDPPPPEPTPLAGTPHASKSNQLAVRPANYVTGASALVQSSHWSSDRAKSMRIISQYLSPGSAFADVATVVQPNGLVRGKTYTMSVVLRQAELRGRQANIQLTGTSTAQNVQVTGQDMVGEQRLTMTFVIPSTGNWYLRLYNNGPWGDPDVWFDSLVITEGNFVVPYFDGESLVPPVRTNMVTNPNFGYGSITGWGSFWAPTRTLTTANPYPGGNGSSMLVSKASDTHTAQGTNTSQYKGWFVEGDTLHGIIRLRAEVGLVLDIGFRVSSGGASGGTSVLNVAGDGEWHEYEFTMVATAGNVTNGVGLQVNVDNSNTWPNNTPMFQIDSAMLANEATGAYFDADYPLVPYAGGWAGTVGNSTNYLYDGDVDFVWSGTPDASTSEIRALGVETWSGLAHTSGWSADRTFSGRKLAGSPDSLGPVGGAPGETLTVFATLMILEPGTVAPKLGFRHVGGTVAETTVDVPLVAGTHEVRVTATIPDGTTSNVVLLSMSDTEVWIDKVIVVAGTYGGAYFDGETVDVPTTDVGQPIGTVLQRYSWTGTPDASTSWHETGTIISVEDPEEWVRLTTDLYRYLHDTGAVSGPLVTQKYESGQFVANQVEFTFVSERPWIFKATKPIALPPSLPVVVQDIPFNLAPYPSAELSSGTVVVATNYATNPSAEANITDWVVVKSVATGESIARSTELSSAGAASAKALLTATNAGTNGFLGAQQDVALPGITPTTRYSVNVWAVASVQSGTAVLGNLEYRVRWMDAASTVLRDDLLDTKSAAGGAVSVKSILPPAGTTKASVRVLIRLTSWSINAVVRLYADALAVTVP
jgi:hypothetical protein